jgi:hypothetical protein
MGAVSVRPSASFPRLAGEAIATPKGSWVEPEACQYRHYFQRVCGTDQRVLMQDSVGARINFLTLSEIAEALQSEGYRGKLHLEEGFSYVSSAAGGEAFGIYCYGRDGNAVRESQTEISGMRFMGIWSQLDDYHELELDSLCNWFNSYTTAAKLYRASDEAGVNLSIETNVYAPDGMSASGFVSHALRFINHFELASKSLGQCKKISKREILDRHDRALALIHGPNQDFSEAAALYRENAHLGFAGSQNNFGDLFENGQGVERDLLTAVYWYTRAAERGEHTAYYSLSTVFSQATNNPDALVLAAKYALLASANLPEGNNRKLATLIRDDLQSTLSEALFDYALELAKQFQPMIKERSIMGDPPSPSIIADSSSEVIN